MLESFEVYIILFKTTNLFLALIALSIISCKSKLVSNSRGKRRSKINKEKKKIVEKKPALNKTETFSTTVPGKTTILLNANPKDMEPYLNNTENDGAEIVDEVVKALKKKKENKSDMQKYKPWMEYVESKKQKNHSDTN